MLHYIDEEKLDLGYVVEWAQDDEIESPREWEDNLGRLYIWERGHGSPDPCPYRTRHAFLTHELQKRFTQRELEDEVRNGSLDSLRFVKNEDGEEELQAWYKNCLCGHCGWGGVEAYNRYRDHEEIAVAIADCAEAPTLLARKGALMAVCGREGAYEAVPLEKVDGRRQILAGLIWASDEDIAHEGAELDRTDACELLAAEVERYSQWAAGEAYAVIVEKDDTILYDSRGYIGASDLKDGIEDAKSEIARWIRKGWID